MTRVALLGECMLELSPVGDRTMALAYAGDVCNTAVALARRARDGEVEVAFATRLGDDSHSDAMLAEWRDEGIDTSLVDRLPGRVPGLYMIALDERGERSFTYYRSESPARDILDGDEHAARLAAGLADADWLFLSGITLSLLPAAAHERLLVLVDDLRSAGCRLALDTNYRPKGWSGPAVARERIATVAARADLVLPTLDDERLLFGDHDAARCVDRLRRLGAGEVVVKLGAQGAAVGTEHGVETVVAAPRGRGGHHGRRRRLRRGLPARAADGSDPLAAAAAGNELAAAALAHRGGIAPEPAGERT